MTPIIVLHHLVQDEHDGLPLAPSSQVAARGSIHGRVRPNEQRDREAQQDRNGCSREEERVAVIVINYQVTEKQGW